MRGKIVIIGAGVTGLTAARILQDNKYNNFTVYEKNAFPGGLTASFMDSKGFTWDSGGHVFYNKDSFADSFTDKYVREWKKHIRRSFVISKSYITRYPFQHHIYELEDKQKKICYQEWVNRYSEKNENLLFHDWLKNNYGAGINNLFTKPYNRKIWGSCFDKLSSSWAEKSFPAVTEKSFTPAGVKFGLNYQFRYPLNGGAQKFCCSLAESMPGKIVYSAGVSEINPWERVIRFSDGHSTSFDYLISTIPLDELLVLTVNLPDNLLKKSKHLKSIRILLAGAGVKKRENISVVNWNYYPDEEFVPYRISNLAAYSPNNTPDGDYNSLLAESIIDQESMSPHKYADRIFEQMIRQKIFSEKDLVTTFVKIIDKAYPVPLFSRENILLELLPYLEQLNIFSRGRNGCWRYETGSIPDCIILGREIAEKILFLKEEKLVAGEY